MCQKEKRHHPMTEEETMTALLFCSELDHRSLSRYLVQAGVFYAKEILKLDYERWRARRIQEIREKGKKAN